MKEVIEVTQFFDTKGMTWKDLIGTTDHPVLLSTDKKSCLWTETPKVRRVKETDYPLKGDVWLIKGSLGTIEIFKANYDSSD